MSRYIDADALMKRMYHDAFETDTDMQKWDSGCWIRYKMFENAMDDAPTIDAVSVVRCKDCKHAHMTYDGLCKYCDTWKDDDGNCLELYLDGDYYCADGEREGE